MNALYIDPNITDYQKREALYNGDLFIYSPTKATLKFIDFTDNLISKSFGNFDPEIAQWHLPVESYVEILKSLKPNFIHHPESKKYIRQILEEQGCDLEKTYFDVPRLRTSTSNGYLTSGIAYAFHPHRDTWYSASMSQINWWMPVYEINSKNGMAFHPEYWNRSIKNDSNLFNYKRWNEDSRKNSAEHVTSDTRWQPKALQELNIQHDMRIISKPGGITQFSAAQLHSSVPNNSAKTRFSIDFRTINIDDIIQSKGAPNIDTACQDLTLGDFIRASDFLPMPALVLENVNNKVYTKIKSNENGRVVKV